MRDEFLLIETAAPAAGADGAPARPRVIGLAYGGGKINLPGWKYPVVVDLAGLALPDSVPLLANHENRTAARVGMVNARVTDNALEIEGEIVASGDVAEEIVNQAKAGADWQLSIGAEVKASELVAAGRQREVNGRAMDGPFYHIQQAVLREVSVVAVGADGTTRLRIVARFVLTPADGGRLTGDGPRDDGFRNPLAGDLKMAGDNREEAFHQWLKDNGIAAEGMGAPALAKLRLAFAAEPRADGSRLTTDGNAADRPRLDNGITEPTACGRQPTAEVDANASTAGVAEVPSVVSR